MSKKDSGDFRLRKWHVALICIAIVAYYTYSQGYWTYNINKTETPFYGNLQIKISENNLYGGSETTSNPVYEAFHSYSYEAGLTSSKAISASGTTFEVQKEDEGIIYMMFHGGDSHFIADWAVGESGRNPRVVETFWSDYDDDGKDEFFAKFDVGDISDPMPTTAATLDITLPLIKEDVSGLTDDNPVDKTSIGTAEVTKTLKWTISGVSEKSGFVIGRLYFSTNATREGDDIQLQKLAISGTLSKTLTSPVDTEENTYTAWYLKPSDYTEVHNGWMCVRQTNMEDGLVVELTVRFTLESGDKVGITLNMVVLNSDGGEATTISDEIGCSA